MTLGLAHIDAMGRAMQSHDVPSTGGLAIPGPVWGNPSRSPMWEMPGQNIPQLAVILRPIKMTATFLFSSLSRRIRSSAS